MISQTRLQKLAKEHGTPLFVIDHDALRKNYREFRRYLPRVQAYYAVKANPDPSSSARSTRKAPALTWRRCRSS